MIDLHWHHKSLQTALKLPAICHLCNCKNIALSIVAEHPVLLHWITSGRRISSRLISSWSGQNLVISWWPMMVTHEMITGCLDYPLGAVCKTCMAKKNDIGYKMITYHHGNISSCCNRECWLLSNNIKTALRINFKHQKMMFRQMSLGFTITVVVEEKVMLCW
jgi:hypothetical protein